jgi:hypothetical protein
LEGGGLGVAWAAEVLCFVGWASECFPGMIVVWKKVLLELWKDVVLELMNLVVVHLLMRMGNMEGRDVVKTENLDIEKDKYLPSRYI